MNQLKSITEKVNEVVESIIDNKNGTSTVIYRNGIRKRVEHMQTKDANMLAAKCVEDEKRKNSFESNNGHLFDRDEALRKRMAEAEKFRLLKHKMVGQQKNGVN